MFFKKNYFRFLSLVMLCLLLTLSTAAAQQPTFNIGILGEPQSQLARGATLIIRQLNQMGGVTGADGTRFQLQPIYASPSSTGGIDSALTQLTQSNVIAIVGPATSNEAGALLPLLPTINIPILTTAPEDSLIVNDNTGFLFRTRAPNFFTERALAEYLINDLGITTVDVIQFDVDATVNTLGFASAFQTSGGTTNPATLINNAELIAANVPDITTRNPGAVVTYGNPQLAGEFYRSLRGSGYGGLFAHPQANTDAFRASTPPETSAGILSAVTWSPAARDNNSSAFLSAYARTFGDIPNAIAAASADAVILISEAIQMPGELRSNLLQLRDISGVQGTLSPADLNPGETSDNNLVVQINEFGAPSAVARFAGTQRIEIDGSMALVGTPQPVPTNTPEGVVARIISRVQNVRTGPSTNYDVIGQLQQDEVVQVVGANVDFSWLVIEFRGRQGWIANLQNLNEVSGDLSTVPLVEPPPSPTPPPVTIVPTPIPVSPPDIVIRAASVNPNPIRPNQRYVINVTVANEGGSNAGAFSVAATLPPDNEFVSANIGGLAAGQNITVSLEGDDLEDTGSYSAVIVADLNNQVQEGAGENNNGVFTFSYTIAEQFEDEGEVEVEDGDSYRIASDLRFAWDGADIEGRDDATVGIITGTDFDDVEADQVSASLANAAAVTVSEGDVVGLRSEDGDQKAVLRVEDIESDGDIVVAYRRLQ